MVKAISMISVLCPTALEQMLAEIDEPVYRWKPERRRHHFVIIRGYKQNKLITPEQNKLINFFVVWEVCYLRRRMTFY